MVTRRKGTHWLQENSELFFVKERRGSCGDLSGRVRLLLSRSAGTNSWGFEFDDVGGGLPAGHSNCRQIGSLSLSEDDATTLLNLIFGDNSLVE